MAILDNAIWLGGDGVAAGGTTTVADGGNQTTITGTFSTDAWDATAGGTGVSGFGAAFVTEPISAAFAFSNPVENLSFDIQHLNDDGGSTFDDSWTIYAYDENGDLIAAADVIAGLNGLVDETVSINADGSVTIEAAGPTANNVTVDLEGPVSQIEMIYAPGSGGTQSGGSGLSDFTFDIPPGPDHVVSGTPGNDVIDDTYLGDTENDRVDNADHADGSDADVILAGAGDDTIYAGAGNDTVDAAAGNDSVLGGDGDDTVFGGDGNDVIHAGKGDDSLSGGAGDDTFKLHDTFGNDTIEGWESGETNGDTLDLSAVTQDTTIDLTDADPETGHVSNGAGTAQFSEIDNIVLGGGRDTATLADGSGHDTVQGFNVSDSGDGTSVDQMDVSALTSDGGTTPVTTADVTVSDNGSGNAVLSFPGGESLTLIGVAPTEVDSVDKLVALGIPDGRDAIVEGTNTGELINAGYGGDPEGDRVDANDNLASNNDDVIEAYGGNDTIGAGAGNDSVDAGPGDDQVFAETGNDTVSGGAGNDFVLGEAGDDSLIGEAGNDTLIGGDGNDAIDGGADDDSLRGEAGDDTIHGGDGNDYAHGGFGNDVIDGGAGDDEMHGWFGNDTISGAAGNDYIDGDLGEDLLSGGDGDDTIVGGFSTESDRLQGGAGDDSLDGQAGDDLIEGGTGNDEMFGADGDDTFVLEDGFGNDTITGGETDEFAGGDTLDLSTTTTGVTVDLSDANAETGTVSNGTATAAFTEIENVELGAGQDTVVLADGGGADKVGGFAAPIDNGDGTYTGQDQLDVSGLTTANGDPVQVGDVTVGNDGAGNAVLSFPKGETITLKGVSPGDVTDHAALTAMGIPGLDHIVEGTSAGETIDAGYTGDPDGDRIDNLDSATNSNADSIEAGGGNDTVRAGADNDTLRGDAGDDDLDGEAGNDTVDGGSGNDILQGGDGDDLLIGGAGNDTLITGQGDTLNGGDGDDLFILTDPSGEPGAGSITITGGEGDETDGDTLRLTSDISVDDITFTNTDDPAGGLSGNFTMGDGTAVTFKEIENIICFTPGAKILTGMGERAVETLQPGDMVVTRDHGLRPIRWMGQRTVRGTGDFAPVTINSSVMDSTRAPLVVSPQHRILFTGYRAELLFGESEVLVAAKHLVDGQDVRIQEVDEVIYIHIMFDRHEVIYAEGIGTESFHAGDLALSAVNEASREELFAIFPELRSVGGQHRKTARTCLKSHEAMLIWDTHNPNTRMPP